MPKFLSYNLLTKEIKSYNYYSELAIELGLSRERIRQFFKKVDTEIVSCYHGLLLRRYISCISLNEHFKYFLKQPYIKRTPIVSLDHEVNRIDFDNTFNIDDDFNLYHDLDEIYSNNSFYFE